MSSAAEAKALLCLFQEEIMRAQQIILLVLVVLLIASGFWYWHIRSVQADRDPSRIVFATDTGECYHRASCTSLRYSRTPMPCREAVEAGYRPCLRCKPGEIEEASE
jgi:hypothetical protein